MTFVDFSMQRQASNKNIELETNTTINHFVAANTPGPLENESQI